MKKKIIFSFIILSTSLRVDNSFAVFGLEKIMDGLKGDTNDVDVVVQNWIVYLFGFLALIAILFSLYGGFLIFTAGDDEEKVKKGKNTLIYAGIGLVIIFLAGPIVSFFVGTTDSPGILSDDFGETSGGTLP